MHKTQNGLFRLLTLLCVLALGLAACNGEDEPAAEPDDPAEEPEEEPAENGEGAAQYDFSDAEFTVGSKEFTEQLILGHITRLALEEAGATVNDQIGLAGTAIVREALEAGEIDMYWEYTGTGWITHLGETEPIPDAQEQYQEVADRDLEENDIRWLPPGPANNTYAIAASQQAIDETDVTALSDFQELLDNEPEQATLCVASEFLTRDDGLPGMEDHYDIAFPEDNLVVLDEGAIYIEVADAENCNFGEVFATDGRIAALDLTVVEDDQDFFPVYNPSLILREEVYEEYPELEDLFGSIAEDLDTETLQDLNASVDDEGLFPEDAAENFLRDHGYIE